MTKGGIRWLVSDSSCTAVLLVVALLCAERVRAQTSLTPDPDIQRQIENVAAAPDIVRAFAEAQKLKPDGPDQERLLFEQLVYFHWKNFQTNDWYAAQLILRYVDISPLTRISVLIPHIYSDDQKLRQIAQRHLKDLENDDAFDHYRQIIQFQWEEPPATLVRWMYSREPGRSLLIFASVAYPMTSNDSLQQYRQFLWSEHVIGEAVWRKEQHFLGRGEITADAVAELEQLSQREDWWARLYVAAMIRRYPGLGSEALIERLQQDPHELVRATLQEAKAAPLVQPADRDVVEQEP